MGNRKGLLIGIVYGTGEGGTQKSAFDDALSACGIHNYNILCLSSVIPEGSHVALVENGQRITHFYEWGHKLYVVMAKAEEARIGKYTVAGLGWTQNEDGRGIFVEHTGESEKEVKDNIKISLDEMTKRRGEIFGEIKFKIVSIKCFEMPVCAIVAAVYESKDWNPLF